MDTAFFHHSSSIGHDTGPGHPERPDRARVVERALEDEIFQNLHRIESPEAERHLIELCHPASYVDYVLSRIPTEGLAHLDGDTVVSPGSREAALRAVGGAAAAVDAVMKGEVANAFVGMRPPGHHAEPDRSMGFCLFNSVAIAAQHARAAHGLTRVAVIDFDVHHGNGTQAMFENDGDLLYASTHQFPHYPGTGARHETGRYGTIVNAPLNATAGSHEFREAVSERIIPELKRFRPQMILLSAGFDADARDPLASLSLSPRDFGWVTTEMMHLADDFCDGRLVSVLEGGYDLSALGEGVAAHVRALMRV